jgi:hypothetical protein
VSDRADEASPARGRRGRWPEWPARVGVERPLPWLVAALVFLANAVLSATRADWWLAALELATGVLAVGSARAVASRSATAPPH